MGLACDCDTDWYPDPGDWKWYGSTGEYVPLPFKRRVRCCTCNELIDVGALALAHQRFQVPKTDVQIAIYGEDGEMPIPSRWMCERCGDLFLSLEELGYCVNPADDMRDLAEEYANEHNKPNGEK